MVLKTSNPSTYNALKVLGRMHCMLMDLLHGFEVLSTTEETLFIDFHFSSFASKTEKVLYIMLAAYLPFYHEKQSNRYKELA